MTENIIAWESDDNGVVTLTIDDPNSPVNTMNDAFRASIHETAGKLKDGVEAGDVTGVEEAPIAMEEGRLAGISAAEACGRLESAAAENLRAHAIERISQLESGTGESRKRARHKQLNDMQRSCCGKEC